MWCSGIKIMNLTVVIVTNKLKLSVGKDILIGKKFVVSQPIRTILPTSLGPITDFHATGVYISLKCYFVIY